MRMAGLRGAGGEDGILSVALNAHFQVDGPAGWNFRVAKVPRARGGRPDAQSRGRRTFGRRYACNRNLVGSKSLWSQPTTMHRAVAVARPRAFAASVRAAQGKQTWSAGRCDRQAAILATRVAPDVAGSDAPFAVASAGAVASVARLGQSKRHPTASVVGPGQSMGHLASSVVGRGQGVGPDLDLTLAELRCRGQGRGRNNHAGCHTHRSR